MRHAVTNSYFNICRYKDMPGLKIVGKRLRAARRRQGLSQQQAAQKAKISKSTLERYENGAMPSTKTLVKICRAYQINPGTLFLSRNEIAALALDILPEGCMVLIDLLHREGRKRKK